MDNVKVDDMKGRNAHFPGKKSIKTRDQCGRKPICPWIMLAESLNEVRNQDLGVDCSVLLWILWVQTWKEIFTDTRHLLLVNRMSCLHGSTMNQSRWDQ